jgi:hypothetical protein
MDRNKHPVEPHPKEFHLFRPKLFLSLWYVWHKPCTYLAPTLTPALDIPKQDSPWPTSPRNSIRCVQNEFGAYSTFDAQPCAYLASWLALSPNGPKQASTWTSSPRSTIGCVQNDLWAYGSFGANRAPILLRHLHHLWMDQNRIPHEPRHHGVSSGESKMISNPMVHSAQTVHLSCVRLALSSNGVKRAST